MALTEKLAPAMLREMSMSLARDCDDDVDDDVVGGGPIGSGWFCGKGGDDVDVVALKRVLRRMPLSGGGGVVESGGGAA